MANNEPTREKSDQQPTEEFTTRGKPDFLMSTAPREEGESKEEFVLGLAEKISATACLSRPVTDSGRQWAVAARCLPLLKESNFHPQFKLNIAARGRDMTQKKTTEKTGMANPECQRKYWEYLKAQYIKRGGMPMPFEALHTPLFEALDNYAKRKRRLRGEEE